MKWSDCMPWWLFFEWWPLYQLFHNSFLALSRGSLAPLHISPLDWYHMHICSVQLLSCVRLFATHGLQHTRLPVHHQLPKLAQTHVHQVGDAIKPSYSSIIPFSSCPQSFPAPVFSSESVLRIRWSEYWSFSCNVSPSNEYSGLISFRMDSLDLLAVQGTLKSLLQHHSSKDIFDI